MLGVVSNITAYACYLVLRIFDHYGYNPLQYLNLKVKLGKSTSISAVKNQIIKKEIKYIFEDYCDPTICYEIDKETSQCQSASTLTHSDLKEAHPPINVKSLINEERTHFIKDLYQLIDKEFATVEDLFDYARNRAWNLWSWIPFLFQSLYPLAKVEKIPKSPGFGPEMNQMVQSDNYNIGSQMTYLFVVLTHN